MSSDEQDRVAAAVAGMRAAPADANAQADGCKTLMSLAFDSDENRTHIASAGGIVAIVAAMHAHAANVTVQEHGSGALRKLTILEANCAPIASAGGIETAIAAMRAYAKNSTVQENGCVILLNLSLLDANRALIASAGGIEAVQAAMRAHPTVADLIEWGQKAVDACAAQTGVFCFKE
jgi:hypothetical protein